MLSSFVRAGHLGQLPKHQWTSQPAQEQAESPVIARRLEVTSSGFHQGRAQRCMTFIKVFKPETLKIFTHLA